MITVLTDTFFEKFDNIKKSQNSYMLSSDKHPLGLNTYMKQNERFEEGGTELVVMPLPPTLIHFDYFDVNSFW